MIPENPEQTNEQPTAKQRPKGRIAQIFLVLLGLIVLFAFFGFVMRPALREESVTIPDGSGRVLTFSYPSDIQIYNRWTVPLRRNERYLALGLVPRVSGWTEFIRKYVPWVYRRRDYPEIRMTVGDNDKNRQFPDGKTANRLLPFNLGSKPHPVGTSWTGKIDSNVMVNIGSIGIGKVRVKARYVKIDVTPFEDKDTYISIYGHAKPEQEAELIRAIETIQDSCRIEN